MNSADNTLSLKNLTVHIGKTLVLKDISFDLKVGEIIAVVGPSGCGKSTLLNVLSGVIKHYDGSIFFQNTSLQQSDIRCGYVPQNLGLLPWKKVEENIFLPQKINKKNAIDRHDVEKIISELDISDLMHRYPSQLSGGQKQRVALARVFAAHPDLLLMDEPFSALDTLTAETSRNLFIDLWKKHRPTTILTTHNLSEALTLGKYILLLRKLPATVYHWIENPLFDSNTQHSEEDFYRFVRQLSDLLRNDTSTNKNPA
ncbi:MAG: ATP-binding cassette domain-containing protein [Bacteroidia bacterium]|nr:ATP-binding cassette domain-containing protein [Bacteroidia bacterium]